MFSTDIPQAALALSYGNLVAFPTETVYGLGADATNYEAVSKIYRTKGRPSDHPLIVHIGSLNQMHDWAVDLSETAIKLAEEFWPGPLTLVLKRSTLAGDFVTGSQDTIALRVPGNTYAQQLLFEFEKIGGKGVAAPSANRFGKVSPTNAQAVFEELHSYLGLGDVILDGGSSEVGIESTIIDCTSDDIKILRHGSVTSSMLKNAIGLEVLTGPSEIRVSGSHKSHYAPNSKVDLNQVPEPGDGLIALDSIPTPPGVVRLAAPINTRQYGQQLYDALRKSDELLLKRVVAIPPEGDEYCLAILDRLTRASNR